ncbi:MAG: hypothetical protein A2X55_04805 [Nitrospirae bacterium GWB2_47_37]|nr:MAG: hypothetical protein A2X55_04805 [Nitrospirae bacterium GWB2_47_37]HAK89638.1 radical SAM protein [Nitrospiraceae bacterium]
MATSLTDTQSVPNAGDFKVLLVYANSPMDNLMPVSISSLAGALKRRGFSIKLFDTTFYPWTSSAGGERGGSLQVAEFDYKKVGITFVETNVYDDFRKMVQEYRPNLIALSSVEPTHEFGLRLLQCVDDMGIFTIMGGVHTIFSSEEVFREEVVDMVCIGEGEKCLVELCERMAEGLDYTNINNIWVKQDGKQYRNKKDRVLNMDDLPMLDFSIYDEKRLYRPMAGKLYRMAPVEFSRGCIFKCAYCSAPSYAETFKDSGKWLRHKSIDRIIEEIKTYAEEYNIEYFYFVSETFLAMSDQRFNEFVGQYSKIGIPFWFNTRPETITADRIKMLEGIGCHRMSVGVECGNEPYRREMLKRAVSNDAIVKACEIVAKSDIQLSVNNIIGFPDETREMIFDTIFLNRKIEADSYSCSIFQPYRGTLLHKYCVDKGYINYRELAIDLTVTSVLKQPCISSDEIKGLARTFPLYVKFPEGNFDIIRKAEKFDVEGEAVFKELSMRYREEYEGPKLW